MLEIKSMVACFCSFVDASKASTALITCSLSLRMSMHFSNCCDAMADCIAKSIAAMHESKSPGLRTGTAAAAAAAAAKAVSSSAFRSRKGMHNSKCWDDMASAIWLFTDSISACIFSTDHNDESSALPSPSKSPRTAGAAVGCFERLEVAGARAGARAGALVGTGVGAAGEALAPRVSGRKSSDSRRTAHFLDAARTAGDATDAPFNK